MPHKLLYLALATAMIAGAPFAASAAEDELKDGWEKFELSVKETFANIGAKDEPDDDDEVWFKGIFDDADDAEDDIDIGFQSPFKKG